MDINFKVLWDIAPQELCDTNLLPGVNQDFQELAGQEAARNSDLEEPVHRGLGEAGILRISGIVQYSEA